jgi:hypothetical protein
MIERARPWILCAVALAAPACYTYAPAPAPTRGTDVRVQLETEAAVRRSEGLEEPIVRYDGVVVDVTPDLLSLDVLIARSSSAFRDIEIRDTVRLRTDEVRSVLERRLSPVRTGLFVLGAGAAGFAVVSGISAVVGGTGDDDGGNGNPTTFRLPLISWTGSRLIPAILGARRDE